ncbi:cell filamentation protein Fic [candidate division WWE3 bacterium CG08_land_8_20_14_0_20_43_13]|uniref:Cell filamentation protein Fic n=1 Tax=candidate division WWE3 bacterium CG08_land_8_20_14_0_20_43_13 TaxID=1975087 RepID=A0A2H0X8G3_UNCKA|nr:MAG: cell filamentation protein Fic [candidate division WWE3 bacterium CG08_land_8_20_14_0_20_43_13]
MNDTNLNARQIKIIEYLASNPPQSRAAITNAAFGKNVSRVTVIRDLNDLVTKGWVTQSGHAKNTVYFLSSDKELFVQVDIESYFSKSVDQRVARYTNFNFDVFDKLENIFTREELGVFESGKQVLVSKFKELDKSLLKRELERFTIDLSWKSSQIEGNTYSLLETEELVKNKREAIGHSKEEAVMILNHKNAFDAILENKEKFSVISLTDIRTLHSVLVKDLGVTTNIREHGVGITGTRYRPLDNKWQIEEALDKLLLTAGKISNIPERSFLFLLMIAYIQPFVDGNKRTARMVSNAILLSNGYFPLSYRSVNEVDYKKALILFYEQNNLYYLKRIFLEQQQFAIDNYFPEFPTF